MRTALLDQIVNAVLYEGYILYPYRPSSRKNARERFTFGRVYPEDYAVAQNGCEPCLMQTECLVESQPGAMVDVTVRFLHPMWREVIVENCVVPELTVAEKLYQSWQEAVEREVVAPPIALAAGQPTPMTHCFQFPAALEREMLADHQGVTAGFLRRRQESLMGRLEINATLQSKECFKLTVRILNQTPMPDSWASAPDEVIMRTFASTHTILHVQNGAFISLLTPAVEHEQLVASCENIGAWPVLVGSEQQKDRDTMLSSPIILYDYPKIAPESGGDFCDGTEIDEMLALRVMTMTDEEKNEMRNVDDFARRILERMEGMSSDEFLKLHGTMRDVNVFEEFFNPVSQLTSATLNGAVVKAGDKVRIRPKARADAFDLLLAGKLAIVEAVEQDAEDNIHLALVLEDDPGRDFGLMRQPGHRFFYGLDEVELPEEAHV